MIGKIYYYSAKIVSFCFYLSLLCFAPIGLRYVIQGIGSDIFFNTIYSNI
jgi:hypothetical protein